MNVAFFVDPNIPLESFSLGTLISKIGISNMTFVYNMTLEGLVKVRTHLPHEFYSSYFHAEGMLTSGAQLHLSLWPRDNLANKNINVTLAVSFQGAAITDLQLFSKGIPAHYLEMENVKATIVVGVNIDIKKLCANPSESSQRLCRWYLTTHPLGSAAPQLPPDPFAPELPPQPAPSLPLQLPPFAGPFRQGTAPQLPPQLPPSLPFGPFGQEMPSQPAPSLPPQQPPSLPTPPFGPYTVDSAAGVSWQSIIGHYQGNQKAKAVGSGLAKNQTSISTFIPNIDAATYDSGLDPQYLSPSFATDAPNLYQQAPVGDRTIQATPSFWQRHRDTIMFIILIIIILFILVATGVIKNKRLRRWFHVHNQSKAGRLHSNF